MKTRHTVARKSRAFDCIWEYAQRWNDMKRHWKSIKKPHQMKRSWLLPSTMDRRSSSLCKRHSKIFKAHPADKTGNDPIEVRYLTVGRQMLEASAEILPCRAAIVYPARWGGSHNFAPSIDPNNPKRVKTTQQPNFVNRIMEPALKIIAISQVKSGSEKGCTLMYIYIYIYGTPPKTYIFAFFTGMYSVFGIFGDLFFWAFFEWFLRWCLQTFINAMDP